MKLNTLKPAQGAKRPAKRVGRGIGSGSGKTGGRGHKGQHSRSGGYNKTRVGFEGGQMPLKRRLPKIGVTRKYRKPSVIGVRLSRLSRCQSEVVDIKVLHETGMVDLSIDRVKIFCNTELKTPITVKGLILTKGTKAAIEKAGGKVIDE